MIDDGLASVLDGPLGRATLGDQLYRHSKNQPDRLAVAYFSREGVCLNRLTYYELNQRVNQVANSLGRLGVSRGNVVAIMSGNSLDYALMYLAAAKLGAVTTGINCNFQPDEITYQIQHAEPVAMMVQAPYAERVDQQRDRLPSIQHFILSDSDVGLRDSRDNWIPISTMYADECDATEPENQVLERDPLFLVYTSGTEAFPKGVLIPHRNYSIATLLGWALGAPPRADAPSGGLIEAHDRWLHLTPLHTIAGLGNLTITLSAGATVILPASPDPALCLSLIERERVTAAVQTPTFFLAAVRAPLFQDADLSSVERIMTYGATMPQSMIDGWNAKSSRLKWGTYWGQSELTQLGTTGWFRTLDDIPGGDTSWIGQPLNTLEVMLVDQNGTEVGIDQPGEAWCRSPGVMLGYHKDPVRTANTFEGGWLHTGDIMRRDKEGNLFFLDRRKDMIKSGGYNVSSQEVEKLLYRHPGVAQAAVVGLPHEYWSEAVTAFVVLQPGAVTSEDELQNFCKSSAVNYKVPKAILFLDTLPVDGQGKILKRELRSMYRELYNG